MKPKLTSAMLLGLMVLSSTGCQSTDPTETSDLPELKQFAQPADSKELEGTLYTARTKHATTEIVTGFGVTTGEDALRVDFARVTKEKQWKMWPNVSFVPPQGTWNWNSNGSLTLDISNPARTPIKLILKLSDMAGLMGSPEGQLNYSVVVPPKQMMRYEMLFNGSKRKLDRYWGGEKINLRKIAEFKVYVQGPARPQTAILDNLRLVDATGDFVSAEELELKVDGPIPTLANVTSFDAGEADLVAPQRSLGTVTSKVKSEQGQALRVKFQPSVAYPNVTFKPVQPWNWSKHGEFNLALDLSNPSDETVQLYVRVDDAENEGWGGTANGVKDSISSYVTLNPGDSGTYYLPLQVSADQVVSGMRAEPPKKSFSAQAISYGWGERSLDVSQIHALQLYLQNPKAEQIIDVEQIRLIPSMESNTSRYQGLIDKYGQYTGYDWAEKVSSDEELQQAGAEALAQLGQVQPMADRSLYGGWAEGPRQKGTGFFRAEKVNGKWALIDPQGYLFFVTGLDNIRMNDTVTITGVDFMDPVQGKGAHVASPLRRQMFTWLPDAKDPLAANYGYAGMVHSGALKKGQVFSFYRANLQRKFQADKNQAEKIWRDVTVDRMVDWGFTTLGNWADPAFYNNKRVAYVANGWIVGEHARISTGNDYWGPIHDPFDPEFVVSTQKMVQKLTTEVHPEDPWMVGIFVDNEISWGNTKNDANQFGLVVNALSYDSATSPAKKTFTTYLKKKYGTMAKLNQAWGVNVDSWSSFSRSFDHRSDLTAGMRADYSILLQMLADKYFSTVNREVKKAFPYHMYLGARFADWGVTPEIERGAAPHVDVISYNLYAEDLQSKGDWSRLPELDKPTIIGEFHFGSTDTGLFHGGIVSAANQEERARKYKDYMASIIASPYFVGAHWFQYIDSPATGRAWDGENYNIGFVTVADEPYEKLIEAAREINRDLYKLRYGK